MSSNNEVKVKHIGTMRGTYSVRYKASKVGLQLLLLYFSVWLIIYHLFPVNTFTIPTLGYCVKASVKSVITELMPPTHPELFISVQ